MGTWWPQREQGGIIRSAGDSLGLVKGHFHFEPSSFAGCSSLGWHGIMGSWQSQQLRQVHLLHEGSGSGTQSARAHVH